MTTLSNVQTIDPPKAESVKLCKDCRWLNDKGIVANCGNIKVVGMNLVYGGPQWHAADECRKDYGGCGPLAGYFEAKSNG